MQYAFYFQLIMTPLRRSIIDSLSVKWGVGSFCKKLFSRCANWLAFSSHNAADRGRGGLNDLWTTGSK